MNLQSKTKSQLIGDNGDSTKEEEFKKCRFEDEVIDQKTFTGKHFEYCIFSDIGAKEAQFLNCTFKHCEFYDCYLVRARFVGCDLRGTKFSRCSTTMATISQCQIDYTSFYECAPSLKQVVGSLPDNPSASYRLLRNIYTESKKIGHWNELGSILIKSIQEQERHYKRIIIAHNDHYRKQFGAWKRVQYALKLAQSRASAWLWGYGHRPLTLIINLLLYVVGVLPFLMFVFADRQVDMRNVSLGDTWDMYLDYLSLSATVSLPFASLSLGGEFSHLVQFMPWWLEILGAFGGLVFFSLFLSILLRYISKGE